ncbi:hypothetical protein [Microbacterium sp. YY-01]|uniref:hypothetical protein n=1 Tax=Microbacterium sp. YY-01 TaxID=3421634 RepID=UPI003D16A917
MKSPIIKSAAALSLALILGVGITGCSAAANNPNNSTELSSSEQNTLESAGGELNEENFAEVLADAALAAGTVHIEQTTDMGGQSIVSSSDVVLSQDVSHSAVASVMTVPGGSVFESRFVDGVFYLNLGELTESKFVAVEPSSTNPLAEQLAQVIDQADYLAQVRALAAAMHHFPKAEGTEEIDGVETTIYTLMLETELLLERQGLDSLVDTSALPEMLDYVLYLGSDNLPRRILMELGDTPVEVNYTGWGAELDIQAPSDDQITESDVLGL